MRMKDETFTIVDAVWLDEDCGYALTEAKHEYAVHWFSKTYEGKIHFTDGQHFMKNNNDHKAKKEARINMWTRANEVLREWAGMDRLDLMINDEQERDSKEFYYNHPEGVTLDEE